MRNDRKMILMYIVLGVLVIALVVAFSLYGYQRSAYQAMSEISQRREDTIWHLQREDIREFLDHARQVMAGEIIFEQDGGTEPHSRLRAYAFTSFRRERLPTKNTHTIESGLNVLEITLDGDTGEIILSYGIAYLDADGKVLSSVGVRPEAPTRWTIERQDGRWVLVRILDYKDWLALGGES